MELINDERRLVMVDLGACREPKNFLLVEGAGETRLGFPIPCLDRHRTTVALAPGERAAYWANDVAARIGQRVRYRSGPAEAGWFSGALEAVITPRPVELSRTSSTRRRSRSVERPAPGEGLSGAAGAYPTLAVRVISPMRPVW
jgi:hypothetical protein